MNQLIQLEPELEPELAGGRHCMNVFTYVYTYLHRYATFEWRDSGPLPFHRIKKCEYCACFSGYVRYSYAYFVKL